MSKEDMEFLEGAMASVNEHEKEIANSVSEVNRISKAFATSENAEDKSKGVEFDKKVLLESLDKLEEHFEEHPSNATSLARQGLLESFTLLLKSDDLEVLSATLSVSLIHINSRLFHVHSQTTSLCWRTPPRPSWFQIF